MPIYEFRCESCGRGFEALVGDREGGPCPGCGARRATRVYSPPAPSFRLVKSRGDARKQERRNDALRAGAKERFKQARARGRGRSKGKANGNH